MSASKSNQPSVILPIISNVMPDVIAEEICSVQPMRDINMINPFFNEKWVKVGIDGPTDKTVYNIRSHEIMSWIEGNPINMWKHYDIPQDSILDVPISVLSGQNYIFNDELEAWFLLRWS